jgi:hypothetical protein
MPELHGPLHYAPTFGKVYLRHIFAPSRQSAELCNYSAGQRRGQLIVSLPSVVTSLNGLVSYFSSTVNVPFSVCGAPHEREQVKPQPYSSEFW